MDLWEETQGQLDLIQNGQERIAIQAKLTDNGVFLCSFLGDGLVPTSESTPLLGAGSKALVPFSSCCCSTRTFRNEPTQCMLQFKDMLAASVDANARTIRLVHCPAEKPGACRIGGDFLLGVRENAPQACWDRAVAWAEEVSARCRMSSKPKHYLVFINPAGGNGTAAEAWAIAKGLFDHVPGITYQEVTTRHQYDAFERVKQMDLTAYNGILVVSGDGLVHEVFNALRARADWETALKMPIGHIPGGSGNGLATSVLKESGESYGVLDMAFLIAKGESQPIDLMSVQMQGRDPLVSFLSLSGAIISDVDIESESLRFLGGARFTVYALWRVINPRLLQAELVYWPTTAESRPSAPAPALETALDGDPWVRMESEFSVFWACNTAWAAYDAKPAPSATLHDGSWTLVLVREASRYSMVNLLLSLETGEHISNPNVEIVQCRAFRLVPRSSSGNLSLDGEVVPFGPIQVWPCPVSGTVLGK